MTARNKRRGNHAAARISDWWVPIEEPCSSTEESHHADPCIERLGIAPVQGPGRIPDLTVEENIAGRLDVPRGRDGARERKRSL